MSPGIGDLQVPGHVLGETEVRQRDLARAAHQHVAGLQVPVQRAGFVQRAERAGDLRGEIQRVRRRDAGADAPAQITVGEILHREIRVVIGNAQLIAAHDAGVVQPVRDLVLLQEALEGLVNARGIALRRRDLHHHQVARLLALGEEQLRNRTSSEPPHAAVTGNPHCAEAPRQLRLRRDAPVGLGTALHARCFIEHRYQRLVHETRPGQHTEGTEETRLARCLSLGAVGQEQRCAKPRLPTSSRNQSSPWPPRHSWSTITAS